MGSDGSLGLINIAKWFTRAPLASNGVVRYDCHREEIAVVVPSRCRCALSLSQTAKMVILGEFAKYHR